jgi:ribosome biogenesis GTPase
MMPLSLEDLGWDSRWETAFDVHAAAGLVPARVTVSGRGVHRLLLADGDRLGEPAGRVRDEPVSTGDWTAVSLREGDRATLHAILPRRSVLTRRAAGPRAVEQMLAANIDTLFLVMGLDGDYNPRRMERALAQAWESGAVPVVLLNKAEACAEAGERAAEVAARSPGVDVHLLSAREGSGVEALRPYLARGRTVALVGSSGVGKSTLVNRLLGAERMATRAVRADDSRGRHTTTHRELILLPRGGCLIDTPGLRELQLWTEGEGLELAFDDVAALAAECRYADCAHQGEPGCAVAASVPPDRLASFHKLRREQEELDARQDKRLASARKARAKATQRSLKRLYRDRGGS